MPYNNSKLMCLTPNLRQPLASQRTPGQTPLSETRLFNKDQAQYYTKCS